MRYILFIGLILLVSGETLAAHIKGPFYFVDDQSRQTLAGDPDSFGGARTVENFHLLAYALGDRPSVSARMPRDAVLAPAQPFAYPGGTVSLVPFAYTIGPVNQKSRLIGLPPGRNLATFLSDPLRGAPFDLSLPFRDSRVALSNSSALLRDSSGRKAWHVGIDFDITGNTKATFDVFAPADGVVEANGGQSLALKHRASNGVEFLTIYGHLDTNSKSHLSTGRAVRHGERIGRIHQFRDRQGAPAYSHLHFGVAVRASAVTIGRTRVPSLWYVIDPFGVYDYRRNRTSATSYNYLRNDRLDVPVRGMRHAYVFRTNPPGDSLPPSSTRIFRR